MTVTYVERECLRCGETFTVPDWYAARDRRGLYCSRECLNASQRRKPGKCVVCGAKVDRAKRRRAQTCGRPHCVNEAKARAKRGANNPNHGKTVGVDHGKREAAAAWYAAAADRCAYCDEPGRVGIYGLHQHHIVYRQTVLLHGGDEWDVRNALTLCNRCHARHHSSVRYRLPLALLPDPAFEFAVELLRHRARAYLMARYAGPDPRLPDR